MKTIAIKLFMWKRGATLEQLRLEFSLHYFLRRSKWRAYWLTFTGS
jgi:hypothetical protein